MLTNGEDVIKRVAAAKGHACLRSLPWLMVQPMPKGYKNAEVMRDYEKNEIVTPGALTPCWWI